MGVGAAGSPRIGPIATPMYCTASKSAKICAREPPLVQSLKYAEETIMLALLETQFCLCRRPELPETHIWPPSKPENAVPT